MVRTTDAEPEPDPAASHRRKEPEPTPAQVEKAMDFLREVLAAGERLTTEVEAEARQAGHARRTLVRARNALHVVALRPQEFGGKHRMALPGDQAVETELKRKEDKKQQARQRQGNGRKRRQKKNGGKQKNQQLASIL